MSDRNYLNGICGGSFDGAEIRRKYRKFDFWDEPDKTTELDRRRLYGKGKRKEEGDNSQENIHRDE